MNFINKLERKFGKYAVSNLIIYVLIAYGIGYVIQLANPSLYSLLELNPEYVCQGQIWRLFTWVCTVPQDFGIFVIFMFLFYYWIGTTLERYWGSFRYNLYMLSGYLFMTLGAMLIYFITGLFTGFEMAISLSMSTYYINLASFLAFATLFPDVQVYFMMILPIKIKWLAIVDAIFLGYECVYYLSMLRDSDAILAQLIFGYGMTDATMADVYSLILSNVFAIVFSVLNFLIFFFATRNYKRISPKEMHRKRVYRQQTMKSQGITKHKCAICGRTEKDDENLVFRFCSKCNGNYEYCQDHLFTHKHVQ